jgi:hypothetical protein
MKVINIIGSFVGAIGAFATVAFLSSILYHTNLPESKECNENVLRAEGCKAIVSALFSDSKISYTYYSDAKQWCHDSYER